MSGLELKAGARKHIAENAPRIFFIGIIYIICTTVISELQLRLPGTSAAFEQILDRLSEGEFIGFKMLLSSFRPSGAALSVVLWLMMPVLDVGYMSYCLKIARGQGGEFSDLLNGFIFFGKILLIRLITLIFTVLWSLLFVFPGIAAYYRYRQAYYILLDDPVKSVLQCIRESERLMAGHKLELFLLDISFLGWMFVDLLVILLLQTPFSLPVIQIWLKPYMGLTQAGFYEKLIGQLVV